MNEEALIERLKHLPWGHGDNGETHCIVTFSGSEFERNPYYVVAQSYLDKVQLAICDVVIPQSAFRSNITLGSAILDGLQRGNGSWRLTQVIAHNQAITLFFFNHHASDLGICEMVTLEMGGEERVSFRIQMKVRQDGFHYVDDVSYLVSDYDGWPCVVRRINYDRQRRIVVTGHREQCVMHVTDYFA